MADKQRNHTQMLHLRAASIALAAGIALLTLLAARPAPAQTQTTQAWTPGWDNFNEPLNFTASSVTWSVSAAARLTVNFRLVGAEPSKLYQVGVQIFCDTYPAETFGQFPVNPKGVGCMPLTRQGVTAAIKEVEFGVVTTDMLGNGLFTLVVGPIAAGTYSLEFDVRDSAGCNLTGGVGNSDCYIDFQSPGPIMGDLTTITVP
jgi:hypothetical protein